MTFAVELIRDEFIQSRTDGLPHDAREEAEERAAETFDLAMATYARDIAHRALNRLAENVFDRPGVPLVEVLADTHNEIDGTDQ